MAMLTRARHKQRTLAAILDDTMGQSPIPVEVVSEAPRAEISGLTVRLGETLGRIGHQGNVGKAPRASRHSL